MLSRNERITSGKGAILIAFAWAMEIVGVIGGVANSLYTTYGENIPTEMIKLLPALPLVVLAVAELGRVPLASVLFSRHRAMQVVAITGIAVLGYLAVENRTFGFERIVDMRSKAVKEAHLVVDKKRHELEALQDQRGQTSSGDKDKRAERKQIINDRSEELGAEEKGHQDNLKAISEACRLVREQCIVPRSAKEDRRYSELKDRLTKERDQAQAELNDLVKKDRVVVVDIEKKIAAAKDAVAQAQNSLEDEANNNQIYRLAAMFYRVKTSDLNDEQFAMTRLIFSTFSAVAIAFAGSAAALVYYSSRRIPGAPMFWAKIAMARRAYYARKRRPIYRDIPVEKVIYRDGKEPATIVEKEVVRWIDRIVLIPRWGMKYPIHANSLIKDDNVAQLRKAG